MGLSGNRQSAGWHGRRVIASRCSAVAGYTCDGLPSSLCLRRPMTAHRAPPPSTDRGTGVRVSRGHTLTRPNSILSVSFLVLINISLAGRNATSRRCERAAICDLSMPGVSVNCVRESPPPSPPAAGLVLSPSLQTPCFDGGEGMPHYAYLCSAGVAHSAGARAAHAETFDTRDP